MPPSSPSTTFLRLTGRDPVYVPGKGRRRSDDVDFDHNIMIVEPSSTKDRCSGQCCLSCPCGCHEDESQRESSVSMHKHGRNVTYRYGRFRLSHPDVHSLNLAMASMSSEASSNDNTGPQFSSPLDGYLAIAPSLEFLSHSPANRTDRQMDRDRVDSYISDLNNDPYHQLDPSIIPAQEVVGTDDTDAEAGMELDFENLENLENLGMTDSMVANRGFSDSESLLSDYNQHFTYHFTTSSIIGVGAGLFDNDETPRRASTCRHGRPANTCSNCRQMTG